MNKLVPDSRKKIKSAGHIKGLRFYLWVIPPIILIAMMILPCCGYHRVKPGQNVPAGIDSVAIPVFRNDTYESAVEILMTDALREQVVRSGFVKLTDVKHADAVVIGTVKKFSVKALSFSEGDFAVEYRITIAMRMKLVARNGNVLWEDANVSRIEDYRAGPNIFSSEAARRRAAEEIAAKLMADVHDRIFDGFYVRGQGGG